jgi:TRAP-type C4-dicarboxylate transport system substrate-binding protein
MTGFPAIRLTLTILAALFLTAPVNAKTTLKIGTLAPEDTPWFESLRALGDEWEEISKGEVKVRIYAGGVMGDEPAMVRKMRAGQIQAATLTAVGLGQIATEVSVLQTPFMFRDDAELLCARDKMSTPFKAALAEKGFVLTTWADAGWVRFFAKEPIVAPDDLKGRKMFFWAGDDTFMAAWRDWGVEPVPMTITDLFVALQSNLVDTMATTPLAALAYQWFPLAPNMTDLRLAPLVGGIVISDRGWAKIPEQFHDAFIEAAERNSATLTEASATFENEAIDAMKEHDLKVIPVPDAIRTQWEDVAREEFYPLVEEQVSAQIMADMTTARDACRSE